MNQEPNYWKKFNPGGRLSRRQMLRRGAGFAGVSGLALAGISCGSSSNNGNGKTPRAIPSSSVAPNAAVSATGSAVAAGPPKTGGTIQMAAVGDAPTLDPHLQTIGGWFINPMYNGLLRINGKLSFDPDLAESYSTEDPVTYVFKLRKGVKFQNIDPMNGREMKAADVKYTWERMATNNPIFVRRTFWNTLDSIQTPDDYTVIFKTKAPFAPFISYVANPWSLIVAKEAVDKYGDLKQHAAGTGPFIMTSRQDNASTKYKRNSDYFRSGMPYADNLELSVVPERSTQVAALRAGKLDYINLLAADATNLRNDKVDVQIDEFAGIAPYYIRMNIKRPPVKPFSDVRVRQAVLYASDPQEMIQTVFGGAATPIGPIPPGIQTYALANSELPKRPDLQKAKDLLSAAGYPNGFNVNLSLPSTEALQQRDCWVVLQGQLAKAGITAKTVLSDWASFLKDQYAENFEMSVHSDSAFLDPDEFLYQMFDTNGARNLSQISDPKLDDLLEKSRTIVDIAARAQDVKDAERYLEEIVPYAYLLVANTYYGFSKRVQNWDRWYFGDNGNLSIDQWWLKG